MCIRDRDDSSITGTLAFSDDNDGASTPNFIVISAAANGSASIDSSSGAWSYVPNPDFYGSDSFTVQVTDDDENNETQIISLTVNSADDISADSFSLNEDGSLTHNVLTNDSFDGSSRAVTAVTQGSNGSVAIVDADAGTLTYTPADDFNGSDSFTYTVTSGGVTETATVLSLIHI